VHKNGRLDSLDDAWKDWNDAYRNGLDVLKIADAGWTVPEASEEESNAEGGGRALICRRASSITPEPVKWVWPGRIARGKQTCIGGDPGTSKSTLSIAIAAIVTNGAQWPCGGGDAPLGNVIVLSAEDGAADTIIPRLLAAKANLHRVHIVTAVRTEDGKGRRIFNLQADLDLLEGKIKEIGDVVLVIIDPVSSYMGRGDSHKNTEVRQVLEPVGEMATRMRVAVLTITHFSKSGNNSTTKALHRFIGSIAFIGAARAGFAVMEDPEEKGRRLFLHAKNNLAPPPQGLAYRLEERVAVAAKEGAEPIYASVVIWDGEPVGQTADDVLGIVGGGVHEPTAKDAVIEFLRDVLGDGPASVEAIEQQARSAGLLREKQRVNESKPFRSAKDALGIVSLKEGFQGGFTWALPASAQA
jgi:putative DNA primase/helicase